MPKRTYSGTALKRLACGAMLLDHIGASCLELGLEIPYVSILHLNYIPLLAQDSATQCLLLLNCLLRTIGRLAMPIFVFFIVEGFLHTKNARAYFVRLVCFGLLSEPIFDFAFFGTVYQTSHQNIYATLALGLLGLILLQRIEIIPPHTSMHKHIATTLLAACGIFAVPITAHFCHTDYGSMGVLLIFALYLLRKSETMQSTALILLTLDQFPAPFAAIPLARYNGQRGNCPKWERWAFYAFYPAHLLILGLMTHFIIL